MPLLNTFALRPVLCVLSEMCVLVIVTKVWNLEGDKKCPNEALVYVEIGDLDLYFGYL